MTTADWLVAIVPAVAVKLAELAPAATFTEAGTDSAPVLLERFTVVPPAGAAGFTETVHVDELPLVNDVGPQASPVTVGSWPVVEEIVIVPPVPLTEIGSPAAVVATRWLSPTAVLCAVVVIVMVTAATIPLAIGVPFIPDSRQV